MSFNTTKDYWAVTTHADYMKAHEDGGMLRNLSAENVVEAADHIIDFIYSIPRRRSICLGFSDYNCLKALDRDDNVCYISTADSSDFEGFIFCNVVTHEMLNGVFDSEDNGNDLPVSPEDANGYRLMRLLVNVHTETVANMRQHEDDLYYLSYSQGE